MSTASGSQPLARQAQARQNQQEKAERAPEPDALSPADRYQELFVAVQRSQVFPDSKTFVDCAPLGDPAAILDAYRAQFRQDGFELAAFVHQHFKVTHPPTSHYESQPGQALAEHIDALWPALTRHPHEHEENGSILQLPESYVVPGGRFGEMYYWDSYFTMVGLAASGRKDLLASMVANFSYLIDTYGHVPNGTRSYYLSRSQPPVFALMLKLAEQYGAGKASEHRAQLQQEHAYWMAGSIALANGQSARRVVRLPNGMLLNRYWDDRDTPREESWMEDVSTANSCTRDPQEVYRNLRAAAESGWDFSSRWLREEPVETATLPDAEAARAKPEHAAPQDSQVGALQSPQNSTGSTGSTGATDRSLQQRKNPERGSSSPSLNVICTTDILPVDLNAFLYQLETTLARVCRAEGDNAAAGDYAAQASARQQALNALCWDGQQNAYLDYDWKKGARRSCLTAACLTPLFVGLASPEQAAASAATVRERLLAPGGLATTECSSEQQWDRPNGWAPLQWIGIRGLDDYGQTELAQDIAHRWLTTVAQVYAREGKLVEKYALRESHSGESHGGGGGEYPLQDGFGWTNGVTRALMAEHPQHGVHTARCDRPRANGSATAV